ncbi:MAG: transcriptional regulator NrdR [Alphaproteobacteria bacterium]|nr:transcriptional regulator NrdR [Alphaproteobacteria bacterium]MCL2757961.1 transcriptional regulator NrdR [Alphaproteobacteria bacterium]
MRCPYCSHNDSQVKDSRPSEGDGTIRRRRICSECGARFTTLERVQLRDLMVKKVSGQIVPFDRDKLAKSIRIACRKREVPDKQIEHIVTGIHRKMELDSPDDIVSSEYIGGLVAESLMTLDPIAFVRFVSVYKKFARISDFKKIIAQIPEAEPGDNACELPPIKYPAGKLF